MVFCNFIGPKTIKIIRKVVVIVPRIIIIIGFGGIYAVHIWIGHDVNKNIVLVLSMYSGNAEDALLSFLQDESNSTNDRTHIAVWTLGKINSEKALPILKQLYNNDPKGETCFGRHHKMLCQFELYKAIKAVEENGFFSYARYK